MNFFYYLLTWTPHCSAPIYQSTLRQIPEYRNPDTNLYENYRSDHKLGQGDGLDLSTLGYASGSCSCEHGNEQKSCIKTVTFLTGSATISFSNKTFPHEVNYLIKSYKNNPQATDNISRTTNRQPAHKGHVIVPRDKAWCFPNSYPDKPPRQWLIRSQQPVWVLVIVLLYRVMPKLQEMFCTCFHHSPRYILTWCLGFLLLASVPYAMPMKYRNVLCDMTPFILVEIW